MRKISNVYELVLDILFYNGLEVSTIGTTVLEYNDIDVIEKWDAMTALAMAVQQNTGTDNGIKKALGGANADIINDLVSGKIKLQV